MKKNLLIVFIFSFFLFSPKKIFSEYQQNRLWQVQSVDTMKTSRDKARVWLHDLKFDKEIEKELQIIKNLGANYVAIDTPYDDEFLPILKRWVRLARKIGLRVWFRGNWSNWEGWFDYPKNLTPDEHLIKTAKFIETHPDLFKDEDIFDPCPECENAGFWNKSEDNEKYNQFIRNQRQMLKKSFGKINKKVYSNVFSIIGGRARNVLDKKTIEALDNLVTIDHYFKNLSSIREYIEYFSEKFQANVMIGEFGAPIPDINGYMDEEQQALFVEEVFKELYKNKDNVFGVNYYVLKDGSTRLFNDDETPRLVADVIKKYFVPGVIKGTVTNTLDDKLENIPVKTIDNLNSVLTDKQGNYKIVVPAGTTHLIIGGNNYKTITQRLVVNYNDKITFNAILEPERIGFIYRLRLVIQNLKNKFFWSY